MATSTTIPKHIPRLVMVPEPKSKHVLILGAGVTGLQTALSLLTPPRTEKYQVTILASHYPGDLDIEYTSPWAGGHWRSHATSSPKDTEPRLWDQQTYEHWIKLLHPDGEELETMEERVKRVGLGIKPSVYFWGKETDETRGKEGEDLWWKNVVRGFEVLDLAKGWEGQKGPKAAVFGVKYQSVCINVPRYLEYLLERVTHLGGRIIKTDVDTKDGLGGVVRDAKSKFLHSELWKGVKEEDIFALINCTGLGARHFVEREEAAKVYPIRGQTMLVKGEAKAARTYVGFGEDHEVAYVIPRPGSGTTILGGCKQVGNWSPEVDERMSEEILDRIQRQGLADELLVGRENVKGNGEFEVLGTQVGFRPGREGGPRVELDGEGVGKLEGVWVVHSYGHSGAGYQNSVGSAEKVTRLISGLEH